MLATSHKNRYMCTHNRPIPIHMQCTSQRIFPSHAEWKRTNSNYIILVTSVVFSAIEWTEIKWLFGTCAQLSVLHVYMQYAVLIHIRNSGHVENIGSTQWSDSAVWMRRVLCLCLYMKWNRGVLSRFRINVGIERLMVEKNVQFCVLLKRERETNKGKPIGQWTFQQYAFARRMKAQAIFFSSSFFYFFTLGNEWFHSISRSTLTIRSVHFCGCCWLLFKGLREKRCI